LLYLTIPDKSNLGQYMTFGETIKKQRESKGLLLRQVAAFLEVDTAFVSKLERNERNASREQVIKLAEFLETPPDHLLTVWLAEKIIVAINNDTQLALKNWKNK
jgi:HTH-type transcriptional regulator, competence development regulator